MDNKNRPSEAAPQVIGLSRDIKRMKADTADTVTELRDFIQHLRGKPPEEVLGLVAQSGLVRATTLATVATIALMAVFTIGPYVLAKASPKPKPVAPAPAEGQTAASSPADTPEADGSAAAGDTATAEATPGSAAGPLTPDQGEALLDRLGEGDSRDADPSVNPLEDSADDLLDELQ
jgi:hypothetical protein